MSAYGPPPSPYTRARAADFTFGDLLGFAWTAFKAQWQALVVVLVVFILLNSLVGMLPFGGVILAGPLGVGFAIVALKVVRGGTAEHSDLFKGFELFGQAALAYLIFTLAVMLSVTFGLCLLLIPLFWVATAFSQWARVMADDPDIGFMEALERSQRMMDGYKLRLFGFWLLLGLLTMLVAIPTCFVGLLVMAPVWALFDAAFYERVSATRGLHPSQLGLPGAAAS